MRKAGCARGGSGGQTGMGHAKELITMDVYGDKRGIIADCVDELQPFIDEVIPKPGDDEELKTENIDVVIRAEGFLDFK